MADEELELDVTQSKGSKTTVILLVVLIVLVLVIGGVVAWLLLGKGDGSSSTGSDGNANEPLAPVKYLTLVPEFIINFGPQSKVRYLQVDLQIATRDEKALKTVGVYRPVLRNDILVVLSGQTFEDLKSLSGKQALQQKLLNTINKVVISAGKPPEENKAEDGGQAEQNQQSTDAKTVKGPIENVYFTSFIMQ